MRQIVVLAIAVLLAVSTWSETACDCPSGYYCVDGKCRKLPPQPPNDPPYGRPSGA